SSRIIRRSARIQKPRTLNYPRRATRSSMSSQVSAPNSFHHDSEAGPKKSNKPFPFFSLPPEIRNMIYRYIVRFRKGVVKAAKMSPRLQLWLVNRRFLNEASALFYSENVFKFYSGYVQPGEDPFGPHLSRVQRCFLHLKWTWSNAMAFMQWYLTEFVKALMPKKDLRYLLVRIAPQQLGQLEPLEHLSGIELAQIEISYTWDRLSYYRIVGPKSAWATAHPPRRNRYHQLLERLMMSDGKSQTRVRNSLRSYYNAEPVLSTFLSGEALQRAKLHGGWTEEGDLFDFFHLGPQKRRNL
ncbi:MAG: hypothetical protein Q9225_007847, partial [Loekoesia sp. 1 TL-2023]